MGKMLLSGITITVVVYILLAHAGNVSTELKAATSGYSAFAKTARGQ